MAKKQTSTELKRASEDTLPKLLLRNTRLWGNTRVAMRKKGYGIWNEYTWESCFEKVKSIFHGFTALGLKPQEKVAIIGDSDPEWLLIQLAVQSSGAIAVGIDPGHSAEITKQLLLRCQPRILVLQDQEQIDKLFEIRNDIPSIQKVIYWKEKGLRHYDNPVLMSLNQLIDEGNRSQNANFEQSIANGVSSDTASIFFVQCGSESHEEMEASHDLLLTSAETVLNSNPINSSYEYVSLMNPGWFFEQALGFASAFLSGQKLNFPENIETAQVDFREVSPDTLTYPTIMWERLALAIQKNVAAGKGLKRAAFNRGIKTGYRLADLHSADRSLNIFHKLSRLFADYLVLHALRDKHGLHRTKVAYAAGKTLSPESLRFFHAIGINIKQIYGTARDGIVFNDPGENGIK